MPELMTQPVSTPPWEGSSLRWYTVSEFATHWRRHPRTIRLWIANGTLVRLGCQLWQDPQRRWWIGLSPRVV